MSKADEKGLKQVELKRLQVEKAARLQMFLLDNFEEMFKTGTMTPTDRATLFRMLKESGWSLDPASIPQGLKGVLTALVDPRKMDDEEAA